MWLPKLISGLFAFRLSTMTSMYPKHHIFKLNDGNHLPSPAFGCGSALFGSNATAAVLQALENDYIHIDNSRAYANEASVGAALKKSSISREKLYITSKYDAIQGASVEQEFQQTLNELQVDYLDLYLIHFPDLVNRVGGLESVWRKFEHLKETGKVKSIGVSNFDLGDMQKLLRIAKIKPSVNQIQYHVYNAKEYEPLIELSNKYGIVTEAYRALFPITRKPGGPADAAGAEIAKEVSERYGKEVNVAQAIFDWLRTTGIAVVTTSNKASRLQEQLVVFGEDFPELTKEQVEQYEQSGQ